MNHPSTTRGWNRVTLSLLAVCLVFSTSVRALDAGNTDAVLVKSIEATLTPHFKSDEPGATVIVTRGGKTLYRGAFGLADGQGNWVVGLVGVQSEKFRKVTQTAADLERLAVLDSEHSFDGDGRLLRLGLQAYALGIAYEFDPYFGL